jgi:exosortase H (IPTLxxWG-CTERM-specific)
MSKKRKKEFKPKKEQPPFFKKNKVTLKAIAIFIVSIAFFFLTPFLIPWVFENLLSPFTNFIAQTSGFILRIFGNKVTCVGNVLSDLKSGSLAIEFGCNGIEVLFVFWSAVLAYPCRIKQKLFGILFGFVGIFLVNQLRIIGLYYVNRYYAEYLMEAHFYAGQTFVIILGLALWFLWVERFTNSHSQKVAFVSH